jgi:hypothetical protein
MEKFPTESGTPTAEALQADVLVLPLKRAKSLESREEARPARCDPGRNTKEPELSA